MARSGSESLPRAIVSVLNLITLGGLAVRGGSAPFDSPGIRKPLALLAVVAAGGEGGVSRDRLQAFFWPESDAAHARAGLKQAQYLVRQAVGVDPFRAQGSNVSLDQNVIVADVAQFQERVKAGALDEAAALYGGPFLDGVYLKDVPEFEQWIDAERARLAGMYARTLERLAAEAAQHSDLHAASEWWRRRADLDRLDSRVARLYMEALAAAGDREAAIRHARAHAELVDAELGAEPDSDFMAAAEQLRATPSEAPTPPNTGPQPDRQRHAATQSSDAALPTSIGATPARRRGLRRGILVIGAVVVGAAILIALVARLRDSGGVAESEGGNIGRVLVTPLQDESHDTSAASFGRLAADWIASGLAQTGLVDVVDAQTMAGLRLRRTQGDTGASTPDLRQLAADAGAKTLVLGRYYTTRDSILVQVMIEDAATGQVVRVLPRIAVQTRDYSTALALLREKSAGAFATLVDRRVESLVDRSTPAPSLAAYHAYAEGLDCFVRGQGGTPVEGCSATRSFQAAIQADSSWGLPYIWLMYQYMQTGNPTAVDSVIGVLDRRHDQLSQLDRSGVEFFKRQRTDDLEGALNAARRAVALAPRSNWTYQAAVTAFRLGRYKESLTFLRQHDPAHDWVRDWSPYLVLLLSNEHLLGEHRAELRDVQNAENRQPRTSRYAGYRLRALAAVGDAATIVRVVDSLIANQRARAPGGRDASLPLDLLNLAEEAAAHGHAPLARQIAERCLAITDSLSTTTPEQRTDLFVRASCLYTEDRWGESRRVLERLLTGTPATSTREIFLAERALVSVMARLADTVGTASHMGTALAHSFAVNRAIDSVMMLASIEAIRGMKSRAVELLRQAPIAGMRVFAIHQSPDFRDLLTYPPFRALLASRG